MPDHKGKFEKAPFTECVAQKKGEYTNATCTDEIRKGQKGQVRKKGRHQNRSDERAQRRDAAFGKNNVECSSSTTTGEITGPTNTEVSVFNGCKFEGLPCKTVGAAAEERKTDPETTMLVDHEG